LIPEEATLALHFHLICTLIHRKFSIHDVYCLIEVVSSAVRTRLASFHLQHKESKGGVNTQKKSMLLQQCYRERFSSLSILAFLPAGSLDSDDILRPPWLFCFECTSECECTMIDDIQHLIDYCAQNPEAARLN
jgi:hypothetical protein